MPLKGVGRHPARQVPFMQEVSTIMRPIALTDEQLSRIMEAAEVLHPANRGLVAACRGADDHVGSPWRGVWPTLSHSGP
jgi:hypothetical protein